MVRTQKAKVIVSVPILMVPELEGGVKMPGEIIGSCLLMFPSGKGWRLLGHRRGK